MPNWDYSPWYYNNYSKFTWLDEDLEIINQEKQLQEKLKQQTNIEKTVTINDKNDMPNELIKLQVARSTAGLEITLQSDFDWSILHISNSPADCIKFDTRANNSPKIWKAKAANLCKGFFGGWNKEIALFNDSGYVNLSYLCADGLREGVTFKYPTALILESDLSRFCEEFKNQVSKIYSNYLRPFDCGIKITIEETRALN